MKHHVLISGAAGGLGKAFAVECASRGWNVTLTDLRAEPLAALAAALRRTYGVEAKWQACDLTDPAQRAALIETFRGERVPFSGLINVAGGDHEGLFCEQRSAQICHIVRLNIESTVELTHALLGLRDASETFHIINVASLAAFYPMPYKATYAASKRFLLDFSLALREELAGARVTVTALCPAGLPTTPACIAAIEAQGLMGQLTTQNIGAVAACTLDAALAGSALYIPGLLNRLLWAAGGLLPRAWVARLIGRRWQAAHRNLGNVSGSGILVREAALHATLSPEGI
jgi:short-subunit dehydrogenase